MGMLITLVVIGLVFYFFSFTKTVLISVGVVIVLFLLYSFLMYAMSKNVTDSLDGRDEELREKERWRLESKAKYFEEKGKKRGEE